MCLENSFAAGRWSTKIFFDPDISMPLFSTECAKQKAEISELKRVMDGTQIPLLITTILGFRLDFIASLWVCYLNLLKHC